MTIGTEGLIWITVSFRYTVIWYFLILSFNNLVSFNKDHAMSQTCVCFRSRSIGLNLCLKGSELGLNFGPPGLK